MIDKLIKRVFDDRNIAHVAHWRTKSFAKHSALGEFYEGVIDKLDEIVETCQGAHGLIDEIKGVDDAAVLETLHKEYVWMVANRAAVCRDVKAVENLFDELTAMYLKTIYKLENLE